jgi:hypothetical protein
MTGDVSWTMTNLYVHRAVYAGSSLVINRALAYTLCLNCTELQGRSLPILRSTLPLKPAEMHVMISL